MKKFLFVFLFSILISYTFAVLLMEENFNFSGNLTNNGWSAHNGSGTNPINTTNGLTYAGYASSGIGNAALVDNTGEDDPPTLKLRRINIIEVISCKVRGFQNA